MKKSNLITLFTLIVLVLSSCTEAGTLNQVDRGNNRQIEVYKYYYDKGEFVYVARFKDTPEVVTTTWEESQGKTSVKRGNIVIFENDSIQVILKDPKSKE